MQSELPGKGEQIKEGSIRNKESGRTVGFFAIQPWKVEDVDAHLEVLERFISGEFGFPEGVLDFVGDNQPGDVAKADESEEAVAG